MAFWDGRRWIRQHPVHPSRPERARLRDWLATGIMVSALVATLLPRLSSGAAGPALTVDPSVAQAGTAVSVVGDGFAPRLRLQLSLDGADAGLPAVKVNGRGQLKTRVVVPDVPPGAHTLAVHSVAAGNQKVAASGEVVVASTTLTIADAQPTPDASPSPSVEPTASPQPTSTPRSTPDPTPDPTQQATPRPTSTPAATPSPTAPPSDSRCATSSGTPPNGWTRRVTSQFGEQTPLGSWPGPVAARDWRNRPAGWQDSSGRGTYDSRRTVSEGSGLLDIYIHSEGSTRYVAALLPLLGDTYGQRISMCMRAESIPGYKVAYLLWPDDGEGNYRGEVDFPEARLDDMATAHAFMHYDPKPSSGRNQDGYDSGVSIHQWHVYTMEWNPQASTPYAAFYLDGRLIGRSTAYVPKGPMHYVLQNETLPASVPLPPPSAGHILIDWVTIDTPS